MSDIESSETVGSTISNQVPPAQQEWSLPEQLVALAEDDPEILPDLIHAFVEDTALRLNRMLDASKIGDGHRVGVEAHAIKGGASQIGALGVAGVCQQLETTAHTLTTPEMADLVTRLESLHQAVCRAMEAFLTESPPH